MLMRQSKTLNSQILLTELAFSDLTLLAGR